MTTAMRSEDELRMSKSEEIRVPTLAGSLKDQFANLSSPKKLHAQGLHHRCTQSILEWIRPTFSVPIERVQIAQNWSGNLGMHRIWKSKFLKRYQHLRKPWKYSRVRLTYLLAVFISCQSRCSSLEGLGITPMILAKISSQNIHTSMYLQSPGNAVDIKLGKVKWHRYKTLPRYVLVTL